MRKNQFRTIPAGLTSIGLALACVTAARADYYPIALTPGSFNADVVVERTATPLPFPQVVNVTVDSGTNMSGRTFYERGYNPEDLTTGLPHPGNTFAAYSNANYSFQMPPTYTGNNCLFIGGANASPSLPALHVLNGTLTVSTPTAYNYLAVLYAAGGSNYISYTVHHQGGGTEVPGNFGTIDWFNTTAAITNVAWIAGGRVNIDNGSLDTLQSTTQPKLFYYDGIALADTVNPVTSIDFSLVTGLAGLTNRTLIFAISGSTDGVNFTPIAVTGFNKDGVVEAGAPVTGFIFGATTVTMDNGTNNRANTYYEKGLNIGSPTTGLPTAGSTFTNPAANRVFKMPATYAGNNCLFIAN